MMSDVSDDPLATAFGFSTAESLPEITGGNVTHAMDADTLEPYVVLNLGIEGVDDVLRLRLRAEAAEPVGIDLVRKSIIARMKSAQGVPERLAEVAEEIRRQVERGDSS